jgi:hypothetical protein
VGFLLHRKLYREGTLRVLGKFPVFAIDIHDKSGLGSTAEGL